MRSISQNERLKCPFKTLTYKEKYKNNATTEKANSNQLENGQKNPKIEITKRAK